MSVVSVSYQTPNYLSVSSCQEVLLCLGSSWTSKTVSGKSYIIAKVENTGRCLGSDECDDLSFPWTNSRAADKYQYEFTYDDTQLLVDSETDEKFVVYCKDISAVFEKCLLTMLGSGTSGDFDCSDLSGSIILRVTSGNPFIYELVACPGESESVLGTLDISSSDRFLRTEAAHGKGAANSIVLMQGNYALAQANSPSTTADLVALIVNANSYAILEPGIHRVPAHGKTIGAWYALSTTAAGESVLSTSLTIDQIRQNAYLALDANTIFVNLQEASLARVIAPAAIQPQVAHGFSVGNLVSRVGGIWVDGVAGQVAYFVKEVLDANTFVVSHTWAGAVPGLVAGTLYAIDPAIDGSIIDIASLDTSVDPITRVGYAPKTGFLLGFCEYPLICCGSGGGAPDEDPPTILSRVVPSLGTTMILTMSESVIPASGITGFSVEVDAVANVIVSAIRTSSTIITLTLTDTIDSGQVVTLSYSGGNVTDAATNPLATIVDAAVTNNSTQGAPAETLIWEESFEGGAHEETYTDGFGISAQNALLVNDASKATDGNYYSPYLGASGTADFQTYYARSELGANYMHLKQQIDVCFKHISPLNLTPLLRLREESGGSLVGLEVDIRIAEGNDGFFLNYRNLGAGETLDNNDIPGPNPIPVVGDWYRVYLDAKINTAIGSNNAVFKWKVDKLQGNFASGTDGTVDTAFIPEEVVTVNSHNAIAPIGFNGHFVAGGNLTTGQARSDTWGLYYDNYKLFSVA